MAEDQLSKLHQLSPLPQDQPNLSRQSSLPSPKARLNLKASSSQQSSSQVTKLSPAQESLRVPLIPCVSPRAGGEVDVCCRDPNYKDPWPEQEQARKESRALDEGDQW